MIDQGSTINGRYRVDRLLGDGGMATVYLGHDVLLGRDVAIKVLRGQYAADPASRVRFRREAQAAAGFSHPNIVDIYDVGEVAGTPYFVMEYVRGQTLKSIIEHEGPFHPDDVAGLLQQVCSALDYAHERGYVHRDVKPQNILVDNDGHAIVVDFGIAKSVSDDNLTEVGDGLGTVHYLSPEQASGLMATPASDVYSAGVVAFEMLTRFVPFDADSAVGIAVKHVQEQAPPPSDFLPSIPPAVDAIVMRALDKDPTKRFPSAGAFASAMTYWRQYRPPSLQSGRTEPTPSGRGERQAPSHAETTVLPGASMRQVSPPARRTTRGRGGGCLNWAIGLIALAGLIGLLVYGFNQAGGFKTPIDDGVRDVTTPGATSGGLTATLPAPSPTPATPPTEATEMRGVPDLVGLTLDDAIAKLDEQDLTIAVGAEVATDSFPPGEIVYQDFAPGDVVAAESIITVRISTGTTEVDLRALGLAGMEAGLAERALTDRGFDVTTEYVSQPGVPAGFVVGTDPSTSARPGSSIVLIVSQANNVQVPADLIGKSAERATSQLQALGLVIGQTKNASRADVEQAGIVVDASGIKEGDVVWLEGPTGKIAPGEWLAPGTQVDLVVYRANRTSP